LEANGVTILRNSAVALEMRGDTAWIGGVYPGIAALGWNDQQWVMATIGEPGRTPILLTHLPAMASRAPMDRYPVVLGGGTFCGRVEVPGSPRLSWLRNEALPDAYIEGTNRLFRVQGATLVIACGVGYGFVPLRFGAAPEVPIVTLVRVGPRSPAPEGDIVEDTLIQRFQPQAPAQEPPG
jgi:uncharacterized protein